MSDEKIPSFNPDGRPTDYRDEFAEQARKLCEMGATDEDLANFFEVHVATIYRWKLRHQPFCEAVKIAKDVADDRVEMSLYRRALGYTFDSEKIFQHQGEIVRAATKEHVPPDATSMIFWLKNRRKDAWRDRSENALVDENGKTLTPILNVSITPTRSNSSSETGSGT